MSFKRPSYLKEDRGDELVKDLLSRMTVQEKIGQLCQRLYGFGIYETERGEIRFGEEFVREVEACGGLGTLYGLYRDRKSVV